MQSYQRFQHIVHTVFNTSGTNGPCSLSWAKAGTHATPALSRAHSGLHGETGGVSDGGGITTLGPFRTFTNIPGPGIRTANFAAFGSWPGVRQKDAESLRDSDALMRVAVPQVSRPRWAALLCLQLGDVAVLSLCAQYFLNVRGWGGTTMRTGGSMCRRITRISSKRITTALSLW